MVMEIFDLTLMSILLCFCISKTCAASFSSLFPTMSDDVVAQVGRSVVIPFGWFGSEPFQIRHYVGNETVKQFIYTDGRSLIGDGFTVHHNNTDSGYELVINTLRHDHAGIYDLTVDDQIKSKRNLTVVSGPSCSTDRSSNAHEAYYHCSLQHTGPALPAMEWPALGECSETDTTNTYNTAGLSIRKSSCTVAVFHADEHLLRDPRTCVLSFIDAKRQKLHQTYTCTTIMPPKPPSSHPWSDTFERMYVRLGHIMYLILLGLTFFIIYCLRNPVVWLSFRLHRCSSFLLFRSGNGNGSKHDSGKSSAVLQGVESHLLL